VVRSLNDEFIVESGAMFLRLARWSGVLLILLALATLPAIAVVPSYAGGSAVAGHIKDGRYYVDPKHSQPIVEVSESLWRTVYWVERLWPFLPLGLGLTGLFLTTYGRGPNAPPPPDSPKELPPWMLWSCLWGALVTVGGTWLFWSLTRKPWATMLVGWLLACVAVGTVVWIYARSLRR